MEISFYRPFYLPYAFISWKQAKQFSYITRDEPEFVALLSILHMNCENNWNVSDILILLNEQQIPDFNPKSTRRVAHFFDIIYGYILINKYANTCKSKLFSTNVQKKRQNNQLYHILFPYGI